MISLHDVIISDLPDFQSVVEIVERKGIGHPDTICDALAENFSRELCRFYRDRFGTVLHHNVDKALLRGGAATAKFGGGTVDAPIDIYLAGRATTMAGETDFPLDEIAVETSRDWLRHHIHALDVDRHVRIHNLVRQGSQDLVEVFGRARATAVLPLANDTSIGVGYAPATMLERLVLATERGLNDRITRRERLAWGEDIKVMGYRNGEAVTLTISCALIGRHIADLDDYLAQKDAIARDARKIAEKTGCGAISIVVNAADDPQTGSVYLTVTGTSAEAGDDGQVGRGNRANGLITPYRPMSLEALAGKNPVSHVGKLYNVTAREIAGCLVAEVKSIEAVQCFMVSRIGLPVTQPALVEVRLQTSDDEPVSKHRQMIEQIVADRLQEIPGLVERFVNGEIGIY